MHEAHYLHSRFTLIESKKKLKPKNSWKTLWKQSFWTRLKANIASGSQSKSSAEQEETIGNTFNYSGTAPPMMTLFVKALFERIPRAQRI